MAFANKLKTLARAYDRNQQSEADARAADLDRRFCHYIKSIRPHIEGRLLDAAKNGRTDVVVTSLRRFPSVKDLDPTNPNYINHWKDERQYAPQLYNDLLVVEHRKKYASSGRRERDIRGASVRDHLTHNAVIGLWDELVSLGLEPFVRIDSPSHGCVDLCVTIPR